MSKLSDQVKAIEGVINKNLSDIKKTVKAAGKVPDKKQTDTIRKLMEETVKLKKKLKEVSDLNVKEFWDEIDKFCQ